MESSKKLIEKPRKELTENINQGDCVQKRNLKKKFPLFFLYK